MLSFSPRLRHLAHRQELQISPCTTLVGLQATKAIDAVALSSNNLLGYWIRNACPSEKKDWTGRAGSESDTPHARQKRPPIRPAH